MKARTWGEFKREVEAQGVSDSDDIEFIEYDPDHTFSGVECQKNDDGKWLIANEPY